MSIGRNGLDAFKGVDGLKAYKQDTTRQVYDGGMAWIFGVRSKEGVWSFFAQAQKYDKTAVGSFKQLM